MAAVTHKIATASTANASTYASGAFTPTQGDLLIAFAEVSATAQLPGAMTASANGITFTKVTEAASGGGAHMLYCFVADQLVGASPASMTVTMDVTGDAGTGCVIFVAAVSGMSKTGLTAIRQSARQQNITTGVPAPVFASACLTGNATLGAVGIESGTTTNAAVPPSGTTERGDVGYATPAHAAEYWSRDSGFTGTTPTWTSIVSTIFGSIAIELDTTAAGGLTTIAAFTSAATSTTAFALNRLEMLAMTSAATSTTAFAPNRLRPLAMTSAATSTSAFALARLRNLTLSSAGASTSTFAMTTHFRPLALTSAGTSTTTFTLNRLRPLALTSAATSTSAFVLRRLRPLALTSAATSTTAFAPNRLRPLALTSAGTSTSAFDLRRFRNLTLTSAATSTSAFALTRRRTIALTSAATSTSVFALNRLRPLAMTSAATSTTAFAPNRLRPLALTSASTSTSTFGLVTQPAGGLVALAMTSAATSTSVFTLNRLRPLALTSVSRSTTRFGNPILRNEVMADGPDVYYPLVETGLGPFVDIANAHNATPNGDIVNAASLVASDDAPSAKFDYNTTFDKAISSYTVSQQPLTIEFWIKPQSLTGSNAAGYSIACSCGVTGGWVAHYMNTGVWALTYQGRATYLFNTSPLAAIGTTQHVVFVLQAGNTIDLYINGVFQQTVSTAAIIATSNVLAIAGYGTALTSGRAQATLGHVAVYKSALSAARIAAHYAAGTAGGISVLRGLAMTSSATSTSSFDLRRLRPLTLTSVATSTTTFDLARPASQLAMTSAATSTSTFALVRLRNLMLSSASTSTSVFDLRRLRPLTFISTSTSRTRFGNPIYRNEVMADGPDAYWRLDETGVGPFVDIANGHNATPAAPIVSAPSLLASDDDAALASTTTTDAIATGYTPHPTVMSVEFWVKPTSLPASDAYVTWCVDGIGFYGWSVRYIASGQWRFVLSNVLDCAFSSSVFAQAGVTQHVVFVVNGTNVSLYINGAFQQTVTAPSSMQTGATLPLHIGHPSVGVNGTIDEPAIYTYALSAARIAAHYAAGTAAGISRLRPLALTSAATSTSTFALARRRALVLTSAATSTSTFGLQRVRNLALTSTATSTTSFALARRRALALTSAATSTSVFALAVIPGAPGITNLAMTSAATSTSTFALRAKRFLAFTSTSTSTTTFTLGKRRALSFLSAGTSTSSFVLARRRAIAFTSAATSTSSFVLARRRGLAFTSTGSSTTVFLLGALGDHVAGDLLCRVWRSDSLQATCTHYAEIRVELHVGMLV